MAAKKTPFWVWFETSFMRGVTFFHIAGLALMLLGGQWGDKGGFDNFGFKFKFTLTELAGFITFFRELARSWIERRKEAKQGSPNGG